MDNDNDMVGGGGVLSFSDKPRCTGRYVRSLEDKVQVGLGFLVLSSLKHCTMSMLGSVQCRYSLLFMTLIDTGAF